MAMRRRALSLSLLLAASTVAAPFHWSEAVPGYRFQFPRDHFNHEDFKTEWWYYTGNVTDAKGSRFGFELVFFRQGQRRGPDNNESAFRIDDMYLAHAAVTQVDGRRFFYDERLNRAGPGIAGASFDAHRVWNGNWSAQWSGEQQSLNAMTADFQFALTLRPVKPLVINGVGGVSQKAYYISFPRLAATGSITVAGRTHDVHGTAWMDHEWFTHQLESNQTGWDWFSIQLDNNTELMLFQLRRKDGSIDPGSAGTFIDAEGKSHHLTARDFRLTPLRNWTRYPVDWRIEVPSQRIWLDSHAIVDNQELKTTKGGTTYWEGAVDYAGSARGVGYLEMTGYDKPVVF